MIENHGHQSIRPAVIADVFLIHEMIQSEVRSGALRERSREWIEAEVRHYLVYEIDRSVVGCVHQRCYGDSDLMEIGSVYVAPSFRNHGVGRKMIQHVMECSREKGTRRIFALTTNSTDFLTKVCQFKEGKLEDLPQNRQEEYRADGRSPGIFYHDL